MKVIAAALVALTTAGSTAAFTAPSSKASAFGALRMSEVMDETKEVVEQPAVMSRQGETAMPEPMMNVERDMVIEKTLPEMSQSMPFMKRPPMLTGEMAGDVGFDPLGFAKTKDDLMNYREAEIKHARLAMLAAAGWPLSEVFDKKIASVLGMTPVLDSADRAPSVLNGGLGKISPAYWVGCLVLAAAIDGYGIMKSRSGDADYFPGNLGFDPLGVYPKDKEGQQWMQTAEIKNGRLAMIAITAFAVQEFVSKLGVVDETPLFFKPLSETLHEYANMGYLN